MCIKCLGWALGRPLTLALVLIASIDAQAEEIVQVGGTGAGLALMRELGAPVMAAHPDIKVVILPSMGTPGGIKALREKAIEIAVAARPLSPEERAGGIIEAACATTALVFASSRSQPGGITRAQLPAIYADPNPSWPDGMPLRVILRSRAGSENPFLIKTVPEMEAALAAAYQRPGMPVGSTDQENAEIAQRTAGSFAVTTLLQILSERLALHPLTLDGVAPSPASIAKGTYPMPFRLCMLTAAQPSSGTARYIAYIRSAAGQAKIRAFGAEPSN
jgi:phosphate transport system substrate-binding protein